MTKKYHVSEDGNPRECSANIKCRFGDQTHYSSKDDARAAYEKEQEQLSSEVKPESLFEAKRKARLEAAEITFSNNMAQGQSAATALKASQHYWRALSVHEDEELPKELAYEKFVKEVAAYESSWVEGDRFDTSIEGPISLTNKSGLAKSNKPGFYSSDRGQYNVYRRGAGPAVSFGKGEYGWTISTGPGSMFVASGKVEARKAAVVLHDMLISKAAGSWKSDVSLADAKATVSKLSSINPGGFPYNQVPRYLEDLERFEPKTETMERKVADKLLLENNIDPSENEPYVSPNGSRFGSPKYLKEAMDAGFYGLNDDETVAFRKKS